jgi:hypothetical protein
LLLKDSTKPCAFADLNNNNEKNEKMILDIVQCLRVFEQDISETGSISIIVCKVSRRVASLGTNRGRAPLRGSSYLFPDSPCGIYGGQIVTGTGTGFDPKRLSFIP